MGILETICAERREEVARLSKKRPPSSLVRVAGTPRRAFPPRHPTPRPSPPPEFDRGKPFLIAECKRASPSKGLMLAKYDPVALASAYERGGASLVSVLTEPRHFLGDDAHLASARAAVKLPILRKDFIVDAWQLRESWALGADAVLLIAACLDPSQLVEFAAEARELGLSVLVETRETAEIDAALAAGPDAIGVNARDLRDFSVSTSVPLALLAEIALCAPAELPRVAESGLKTGADALPLRDAGYDGFLVGEALATSADPESASRDFVATIVESAPDVAAAAGTSSSVEAKVTRGAAARDKDPKAFAR